MTRSVPAFFSAMICLAAASMSHACGPIKPPGIEVQAKGNLVIFSTGGTAAMGFTVTGILRGAGKDIVLECPHGGSTQKLLESLAVKSARGDEMLVPHVEVKGRLIFRSRSNPDFARKKGRLEHGAPLDAFPVIVVESLKIYEDTPAPAPANAPRP